MANRIHIFAGIKASVVLPDITPHEFKLWIVHEFFYIASFPGGKIM